MLLGSVYAYSAYGEVAVLGPDGGNALQYTGRENDGTGLYFYRARTFDPILKRFTSEDPIGIAGGINVYSYVGGKPTQFIDPDGRLLKEVVVIVLGAIVVKELIDFYENSKTVVEKAFEIKERFDNKDQFAPPPGKNSTDINPATGNPYIVDEMNRSRRDLFDTTRNVSEIGGAVTDQLSPGPSDLFKHIIKKCLPGTCCPGIP